MALVGWTPHCCVQALLALRTAFQQALQQTGLERLQRRALLCLTCWRTSTSQTGRLHSETMPCLFQLLRQVQSAPSTTQSASTGAAR